MSNRLILAIALFAARALAQPGVCYVAQGVAGVTTGCSLAGTPTAQSFYAGLNTSYNTMWASIAALPQPAIEVYANVAMQATNRNQDTPGCQLTVPNSCVFSNLAHIEAYITSMVGEAAAKGAGVVGIDYNYDALYGLAAPHYATYCAQGSNICGTAATPSWNAYQLSLDIAWIGWAQTTYGLKVRLSSSPLQSLVNACSLAYGSVTAAQEEACLNPAMQAYIDNLCASDACPTQALSAHEVTGYWHIWTGVTYSASDFVAIGNSGCAAIVAATGASGVTCGVGFTAADTAAINAFIAGATGASTVFGFESYGGATSAGYAGAMATMAAFFAAAIGNGLTPENTEGNPTVYTQTGAPGGSEQYATPGYGCASPVLQVTNANPAWLALTPKYWAAFGAKSSVWFGTEPAAQFDLRASANCYLSTAAGSLSFAFLNTSGPTVAAASMQAGATWAPLSVQGFLNFTGSVTIQ
jgi:hypothetical protein